MPEESSINKQPPLPLADTPGFQKWGLIGLLILFTVFTLDFMRTDLWFDELLTLGDYGAQQHLSGVFTNYEVANNHILFSAALWIWLRVIRFIIAEEVLRFPCLLLALITISTLYVHGRRLFGNAAAYLLAVLLAFSPVFLSFFYQLRGYGLTIFLSLLATLGAFYIITGQRRKGTVMYVIGTVLLPGVIPSNLLFNGSLFLFLSSTLTARERSPWQLALAYAPLLVLVILRAILPLWFGSEAVTASVTVCTVVCLPVLAWCWWPVMRQIWIPAIATVAGMAIYIPIWDDFRQVISGTGGWASGPAVAGHWCIAIAAHLGLFVIGCLCLLKQPKLRNAGDDPEDGKAPNLRGSLWLLALCCIVPMLDMALWRAPYPRAFLAYLVPLTFCALIPFRNSVCRVDRFFLLLIFFVLANDVVWFRLSDHYTRIALHRGEYKQDLIQQFYTRNEDIYYTTHALAQSPIMGSRTRIFVDFHEFIAFAQYWQWRGGRLDQVECLNGGGGRFAPRLKPQAYQFYPQLIVSHDPEFARKSYEKTLGLAVQLQEIYLPSPMRLFRVIPINPEPIRPPINVQRGPVI